MTQKIGSYEVLDELGRGAAGRVFRSRAPSGEEVAIKLLLDSAQADDRQRRRFQREIEALARLEHPNVIRVHGVGEHHACPYLVMDLIRAEALDVRLTRDGPLPPEQAARLTHDLALALAYCHDCGVIHRDIKPANVLLDPEGVPLLTDFGLSKDMSSSQSRITRSGVFLGTPGYWAPELARGDLEQVGPRSDVYGLGATLYAMLTGRPPIEGETLVEILMATEERAPVPPRQLRPEIPAELEAICLRCLEKQPEARYPSATALARELARLQRGEARERAAPRPGGWSAGVLALALVGLGTVVALSVVFSARVPAASRPTADGGSPPPPNPSTPAPPPPDPTQALLDQARRCLAGHALDEGLAVCDRLVQEHPRLARAWFLRAKLHGTAERWEDALLDLNRGLELDASDYDSWADRALTRSKLGDLQGCIADYTRALELKPDFAEGYHDRGIAKDALGDTAGAIDDYSAALQVDPTLARAWSARAGSRLNQRDYAGALQDCERALALDPNSAVSYSNRGAALASLERPAEAQESLTRALELDPRRVEAWVNRGALRASEGDVKGGLADLEQALQLDPYSGSALLARAQVELFDARDPQAALTDLRHAQRVLPPRSRLARVAHELEQQALSELRR